MAKTLVVYVLVFCDGFKVLLLFLLLLCLQNQIGVPAADVILGKLIVTPKKTDSASSGSWWLSA